MPKRCLTTYYIRDCGSRPLLLLLLLAARLSGACQYQTQVIAVQSHMLVYDPFSDRIFASLGSANGPIGNSIAVIDPHTASIENTVFIGSEPTVLAISDDGQYIYAGFSGSSTIRRFDVPAQTADIQFPVGIDPSHGPLHAEDIKVMPGQNTTIAVARMKMTVSPRHGGVVIFDNNVQRPLAAQSHLGSNRIVFDGPDQLWGFDNESTGSGLRHLEVTEEGVTQLSVHQGLFNLASEDLVLHGQRLYARNGLVVTTTDPPVLVDQFPATGPLVHDAADDLVCFMDHTYSGNITLKRFDPQAFLLVDQFPVDVPLQGVLKSMVTCGNGCYAFNSGNHVVILKDELVGLREVYNGRIVHVYPNPVGEMMMIPGMSAFELVQILDMNGRTLKSIGHPASDRLDIQDLAPGKYMVRIVERDGTMCMARFIK